MAAMRVLLRLARYGLDHKQYLFWAWVSLLGANALALAIPWLIGGAVDHALTERDKTELVWLALLILGLSALRGLFSYGQTFFSEALSAKVSYVLRNTLLKKLQGMSFAFHDQHKTGDMMSIVTYDVESTRQFISFGLVRFVQLVILIAGITPLLIITHWQLGLISLACVPPTVYTSAAAGRKMRKIWNRVQVETGEMSTALQENLTGMRVVKSFGAEESQKSKFHGHSANVAEDTYAANKLRVTNSSFLTFVYLIATGLVVLLGGRWVIDGSLTAGEWTQFMLYLGLLVMPVRMLGMAVNTFSRALSSGERVFELLDSQSPVDDEDVSKEMAGVKGEVRFDGVSFGYNPAQSALKNISFTAKPGEKVAILGAAGSGKTTIVNLIPRFYDPTTGRITIDGMDIRGVTLESLRRNVGMVFQDVFLFHASVKENIAYGASNATLEKIIEASKAAQLHQFIESLPQGYETLVGERGVTLSGGQRQRLAIARTLLLDPPVLILDDSTSSVDVETEGMIRKALEEVMKRRTTFIIAHRVSSVRLADQILVLKDGEIVERGAHNDLISREGFYKQIYELQILPSEQVLLEASISDDGNN
ncbi:MAG: ABC transporter ATP-binding protein [SAR202 cluster bacterium]|nr:ABC transporter ATP-binding protein [SAR202 cluster bacterium]